LVEGCSLSPDDCFAGTECCTFGPTTLCIEEGACVQ
jgi:hypothetical protein